MGTIRNKLTIVHDYDEERIKLLRQTVIHDISEFIKNRGYGEREIDGNFVSGILESMINAEYTFVIMGDCSKLGWEESEQWEKFRNKWCKEHKNHCQNMLVVEFGEDMYETGAQVTEF